MKPIVFQTKAAQEAMDAAVAYEEEQEGLGDRFRAELRTALIRIQENPELYAKEFQAIRICPIHRFPYLIFYEDRADCIWVAAVGHHRRRPGYWVRRRH